MTSCPTALRPFLHTCTLLLLCSAVLHANAQVYKVVGPDGKVTFSDKPPSASEPSKKVETVNVNAGGGISTANLPFELKAVTAKYPVTLYTTAKCAPCDAGRIYLTGRGIPFMERTVTSDEEIKALEKLAGGTAIPVLTIGKQKIKGMSETDWGQYLDAAGYPKRSALPKSYKNPAPSPLIPAPSKEAPAKPEPAVITAPPPVPPAVNPDNPAGIRF